MGSVLTSELKARCFPCAAFNVERDPRRISFKDYEIMYRALAAGGDEPAEEHHCAARPAVKHDAESAALGLEESSALSERQPRGFAVAKTAFRHDQPNVARLPAGPHDSPFRAERAGVLDDCAVSEHAAGAGGKAKAIGKQPRRHQQ